MKHSTHTSKRLVTTLLVLALCMVAGPASAWPDERPAPGLGVVVASETLGRPAPAYGVSHGLGATGARTLAVPAAMARTAEPGIDWRDVGIGIAIGAGVVGLAGLAVLTGRRRSTLQST